MINEVTLIGRVGREPEVRFTASGQAVANFSLATDEKWKDKDGAEQKRTTWHRIVAWGKLGEICGQYLAKGQLVYIRGRIQVREYEDKDGAKRTATEVVADTMKMLGGKRESGSGEVEGGDDGGEEMPF